MNGERGKLDYVRRNVPKARRTGLKMRGVLHSSSAIHGGEL